MGIVIGAEPYRSRAPLFTSELHFTDPDLENFSFSCSIETILFLD